MLNCGQVRPCYSWIIRQRQMDHKDLFNFMKRSLNGFSWSNQLTECHVDTGIFPIPQRRESPISISCRPHGGKIEFVSFYLKKGNCFRIEATDVNRTDGRQRTLSFLLFLCCSALFPLPSHTLRLFPNLPPCGGFQVITFNLIFFTLQLWPCATWRRDISANTITNQVNGCHHVILVLLIN